MKLKIQALKTRDIPTKFGTWKVYSVKFENHENPQYGYDLMGYGEKTLSKIKVGDEITGYITKGSRPGKDGKSYPFNHFNKVTSEYVYDLLLKMNPQIESVTQTTEPEHDMPENW